MPDAKIFLEKSRWLGHAGFLIQDRLTVYVDPFQVPSGLPIADVVLLTHNHPDHCSGPDVMKVSRPQTVVVGPADAVCRFRLNQLPLHGGQTKTVLGMSVTGTVAYTREAKHERGGPWLGFLIEALGLKVLHAGDTERVPELADLRADVALLPVAGGTMTPEDAARLAGDLEAKLALPMHFGPAERPAADAFVREASARGIAAAILEAQPA